MTSKFLNFTFKKLPWEFNSYFVEKGDILFSELR